MSAATKEKIRFIWHLNVFHTWKQSVLIMLKPRADSIFMRGTCLILPWVPMEGLKSESARQSHHRLHNVVVALACAQYSLTRSLFPHHLHRVHSLLFRYCCPWFICISISICLCISICLICSSCRFLLNASSSCSSSFFINASYSRSCRFFLNASSSWNCFINASSCRLFICI